MTDFLAPSERSLRMSRIPSQNTKPEIALRHALHRLGLRFRLGGAGLPGRPDIVLSKHRAVVFVHGCFWHRHCGCKVASIPKSNTDFWVQKFERNVARDASVKAELEALGWHVLVAWECEVSAKSRVGATALRLAGHIRGHPNPED